MAIHLRIIESINKLLAKKILSRRMRVKIDDIIYDNKGEKATDAAVYYGGSTPYINQKTDWACLVTALVMLFRGSGNNSISENTFIKFATDPPAFSPKNTRTGKYMLSSNNLNMAGLQKDYPSLKRESKNLKTQSDVYERYKTKLKEHQKPLIIRISGTSNRARGHFVVLVGISKTGNLIIHNPGSKKVAFKDTDVVESKMLKNGEQSSGFNCDIIYNK
jgi:ABC-type bacteriocin/lantibiotic exporter with double-glycine peptidase domain